MEDIKTDDVLTPGEPLPISALSFPNEAKTIKVPASDGVEKVNVEEQKVLDSIKPAFDEAAKEADILEKAHDPLGAILEKNVTETRDALLTIDKALETDKEYYTEPVKYYLSHNNTQKIHSILKNRGMDSQQAEQALKEIIQIIEG